MSTSDNINKPETIADSIVTFKDYSSSVIRNIAWNVMRSIEIFISYLAYVIQINAKKNLPAFLVH